MIRDQLKHRKYALRKLVASELLFDSSGFLLSYFKIIVSVILFFKFIPEKIFKKVRFENTIEFYLRSSLKILFSVIVVVQVLSLIGILDTLSVVFSLCAVFIGVLKIKLKFKISNLVVKYYDSFCLKVVYLLELENRNKVLGSVLLKKLKLNAGLLRKNFGIKTIIMASIMLSLFSIELFSILDFPFIHNKPDLLNSYNIKLLGTNKILDIPSLSVGFYSIIWFFKLFLLMDVEFLYRIANLVMITINAFIMFYGLRLITTKNSLGVPLIATVLVSIMSFSSLGNDGSVTNFATLSLAASITMIGVLLIARHKRFGKTYKRTYLYLSFILLSIAPISFVLLSSGVLLFYLYLFLQKKNSQYLNSLLVNSLLGAVPYVALQLFRSVFSNNFSILSEIKKSLILVEGASSYLIFEQEEILFVGTALSIALLFLPIYKSDLYKKRIIHNISLLYLGMWACSNLTLLIGYNIIPVNESKVILYPLACLLISLFIYVACEYARSNFLQHMHSLRRYRYANLLFSLIACLVVIISAKPRTTYAEYSKFDYISLDKRLDIKKQLYNHSWSIVGPADLAYQIYGHGYHISHKYFLDNYFVDSYKWHPKFQKNVILTAYTYIYVDKKRVIEEDNGRGLASDSLSMNYKIHQWCMKYMMIYTNMEVYHEDSDIIIFEIHRTVDEEKEISKKYFLETN